MKRDLLSCTHTILHGSHKAPSMQRLDAAASAVGNVQWKNSFTSAVQLPVTGVKPRSVAEC